ncbi:hypothetical protein FACS1894124_7720 [Spirochaetia bacterium]|nr:hypothetical protein FACS1894124_7720 [Spirochaetia bacterium]
MEVQGLDVHGNRRIAIEQQRILQLDQACEKSLRTWRIQVAPAL